MDARALAAPGARHRSEHRGADHRRAGPPAASRSKASAPVSACCACSAASIAARAETVSLRAIEIGALSYASVASILKHRLDQTASPQAADGTPMLHDNIRGSRYYH